ncbi:MAG TPA: TSUP family transporter [Actinomycetota bacterium]|nr:TSUP family transporter [Actinomycetota bacterium]
MSRVRVATIASGFVAGLMSGLLGVGGGIVMVPLLVYAAHLSQHQAHATSLAAVIAIGAAGAATFASGGEVDLALAGLLALGSLVGAPLGANVMARTPEGPLKIAFGILMIAVAGLLVWM